MTLVLLLSAIADVATTAYGLSLANVYEGNPFAAGLVAHYGIAGLAAFKLAGVAVLLLLRFMCGKTEQYTPMLRHAPTFIALFPTLVWGTAALNNALIIWRLT